MTGLWLSILIIGVATYAFRALPLFLIQQSSITNPPWLDRLGPCLLAAMAAVVIFPEITISTDLSGTLATVAGLMAAGGSMWLRRNPGLATLFGMVAFYGASLLTPATIG